MHDEVNNPGHYNQNGIEVIDVIETYAKEDFRLANVIKYVCRCEYKGHKLQDLKKAAWYLNRVIAELEPMKPAWYLERVIEELDAGEVAEYHRKEREAARELTQTDPFMVPVIHSIGEEGSGEDETCPVCFTRKCNKHVPTGECENNIHERIAGDCPTAQKIKCQYYGVIKTGVKVRCDDGWEGVVTKEKVGHFHPPEHFAEVCWTHFPGGDRRPTNYPLITEVAIERLEVIQP